MKHARFLVLLLLVTGFGTSFSQERLEWVNTKTGGNQYELNKILHRSEIGFYSLSQNRRSSGREAINLSFHSVQGGSSFDRAIDLIGLEGEELEFSDAAYAWGKFYIFSKYFNKREESWILHVQIIDLEGKLVSRPQEIDKTRAKSKKEKPRFEFIFNQNNQNFLVVRPLPLEQRGKSSYAFSFVDASCKVKWRKHLDLPFDRKILDISEKVLDSEGNLIMLAKLGVRTYSFIDKPESRLYKLLHYDLENNRIREFEITLGKKEAISVKFIHDEGRGLLVAGFYSEEEKLELSGLFYLEFETGEGLRVKKKGLIPLPDEEIKKLTQLKNGLRDFHFQHLVRVEDGSHYFIAERRFIDINNYTDMRSGALVYDYYYHYGDLIVVKLDNEFRWNWMKVIEKEQSSKNDGGLYSSFIFFDSRGYLYFIYGESDFHATASNSHGQARRSPDHNRIVKMGIDSMGELKREVLLDQKNSGILLRPKLCFTESKGVVLYATEGKKQHFGALNIE